MKVCFLADADLNKAIVSGVLRREPSLDFLTAQAAGLRRMTDPEVLALAAQQKRVLVSHDVGTMPAHFRAFKSAGKHSAGVFLVPQSLDVGSAIDEVLLIWLASEASEWRTGWSGCRSEIGLPVFEDRSQPPYFSLFSATTDFGNLSLIRHGHATSGSEYRRASASCQNISEPDISSFALQFTALDVR